MADERYPSVLGRPVELSDERRAHILDRHPSVAPFLERTQEVLLRPEAVRRSTYDPEVLLFSRFYSDILGGKHLVIVVKIDGRCFVLTAYLTRRRAGGQPYEGEHPVLV
jgi:hypothetical protein